MCLVILVPLISCPYCLMSFWMSKKETELNMSEMANSTGRICTHHICGIKRLVLLHQVGCATTCCPWRIGRTWERAAGHDAKSTTIALHCLEALSLSPAVTSTQRYSTCKIRFPWSLLLLANYCYNVTGNIKMFPIVERSPWALQSLYPLHLC